MRQTDGKETGVDLETLPLIMQHFRVTVWGGGRLLRNLASAHRSLEVGSTRPHLLRHYLASQVAAVISLCRSSQLQQENMQDDHNAV
jgi:hypothetical protein